MIITRKGVYKKNARCTSPRWSSLFAVTEYTEKMVDDFSKGIRCDVLSACPYIQHSLELWKVIVEGLCGFVVFYFSEIRVHARENFSPAAAAPKLCYCLWLYHLLYQYFRFSSTFITVLLFKISWHDLQIRDASVLPTLLRRLAAYLSRVDFWNSSMCTSGRWNSKKACRSCTS